MTKANLANQANVISKATFKKIRPRPKLLTRKTKLRGYSGEQTAYAGIRSGVKRGADHTRSVCLCETESSTKRVRG